MVISVDYDDTYTKDPDLWETFIKNAIKRGHTVYCVTMRYPEEGDDVLNSIGKHCEVIFTKRLAKSRFLANMNIYPNVWIDDSPFWIYRDAL